MTTCTSQKTPPIFEAGNTLELLRLYAQHALLTEGIGGLFPSSLDLGGVAGMLDLGSTIGGWALEAARSLERPCLGLESRCDLLTYAQSRATLSGMSDLVTFEERDLLHPLPFADASFDLVNLGCLVERVPMEQWPAVLRECFRVVRHKGFVVWTEAEWPVMASSAAELLARYVTDGWWKAGYGFSRDGRTLGVLHALPTVLREMGWCDVQCEAHLLDFSAWQPHHALAAQYVWTSFVTMQPFLSEMGYGSQETLYAYCDHLAQEMDDAAFQGAMSIVRVWGQKGVSTPYERPHLPLRLPQLGR